MTEGRRRLPTAIQHVWERDTPAELGGWIAAAGGDPAEHFGVRPFDNHPWVGLTICFPAFADKGLQRGVIETCLTHPQGELMFDVRWDRPVGSLLYNYRQGYYIHERKDLPDKGRYCLHRYRAHELWDLAEVVEDGDGDREEQG